LKTLLLPLFAITTRAGYQQIDFQVPQDLFADPLVIVEQNGNRAALRASYRAPIGDFFLSAPGTPILHHATDWPPVIREKPARRAERAPG
jgi:hypothetical protein